MAQAKIKNTDDVLKILCDSVQHVLRTATQSDIRYSPMVLRGNKTCLQPDIGCFVMFDGGFSGLVVMNFSANAAIEIYRKYMLSMGMPEDELAAWHTSDEVSDTLGELMNQSMGNFGRDLKHILQISVRQNQPKMIVINQALLISINAQIDRPQYRKASFETESHSPFYLECCLEKVELAELVPREQLEREATPEDIIRQMRGD